MSTETSQTHRKPRFQAGLSASIQYRGENHNCTASNLSRTGTLLSGDLPQVTDERIGVTLASSNGDLLLHAECRVARVWKDAEKGHTNIGIEFDKMDAMQQSSLESLIARVLEGSSPAPLAKLTSDSSEEEIHAALEQIPLAHRIALATRADARDRMVLIQDTNPMVLEGLARNPRMTIQETKDLVRILELRPSTLEILSKTERFKNEEELKILIATHSKVTLKVAEKVAFSLGPVAVQQILQKPGLHQVVKLKLAKEYKGKQKKSW